MPLSHGYGVVVGTLDSHHIDPPDQMGLWPHYHVHVSTPQGTYECVINLKSQLQFKVECRDFRVVSKAHFQNILGLSNGFHSLGQSGSTGALDAIRHPGLKNPICCEKQYWWYPFVGKKLRCNCTRWWLENGTNLIDLMEYYLTGVSRVYIFGEPYTSGLGIHNVHMNQGDPVASQWSAENGIWQDGGLLIEYATPQQRLTAFMTKFETQSLNTDQNGRPI